MRLFLSPDLCKGEPAPRQGTYVGRVQTSMGADGTPIYKYFYDPKEYEQYMANKRSGKVHEPENKEDDQASPKHLKEKVAKESEESKKRVNEPPGAKEKKIEKSIRLYVKMDPVLYMKADR